MMTFSLLVKLLRNLLSPSFNLKKDTAGSSETFCLRAHQFYGLAVKRERAVPNKPAHIADVRSCIPFQLIGDDIAVQSFIHSHSFETQLQQRRASFVCIR
jgi:hypothetical protein